MPCTFMEWATSDTPTDLLMLHGDADFRAWQACVKYALHLIEQRDGPQAVRTFVQAMAQQYPRGYNQRAGISKMLEARLTQERIAIVN